MSRNASSTGSFSGSFNGSFTGYACGGGGRGTITGGNTPNGFRLVNRDGGGVGIDGKLTVFDIRPLFSECSDDA
jgi:hypothetical protein